MAYSPSGDLRRFRVVKKTNPFFDFILGLSAVKLIIGLNIILFFVFSFIGVLSNLNCSQTFCKSVALSPSLLFENNYWWTLLTSMFMHSGFMHLLVNMFSLFFVGSFLEMLIGKKRFIGFYLFAGIFAGLFYAILSFVYGGNDLALRIFGSPDGFALGASGAIFGVAGVLAVLTPKNKVYLIAGPLVAIILEYILMAAFNLNSFVVGLLDLFVFAYIIISLFAFLPFNTRFRRMALPLKIPLWLLPIIAIVPLVILGLFVELPIGNMAHLGGFIAGALYGLYIRLKYKKKTRMIEQYFSR